MSRARPTADGLVRVALDRICADGDVDHDDVLARITWSALTEPGDGVAGGLVAWLGPARALDAVVGALEGKRGPAWVADACSADSSPDPGLLAAIPAALERWSPRVRTADVLGMITAAEQVHAQLVVPGDRAWPNGLDDLGPHAPHVLWARSGSQELGPIGGGGLAVVGSRANTVYGAESAAEIVSTAGDAGVTIVSGGAYGIDAVAHRVALAAETPTVAVLAGGVDQLYPVGNLQLLQRIIGAGVVVAESPPGTRPSRWRFLQRNRAIAAMTGAVVVVEAGHRSGALNTAHHAGHLGRPVCAVPGPMSSSSSAGCHRLIAEGRATLLCRPGDAVDLLRREFPAAVPLDGPVDDPMLVRVLDALGRRQGATAAEVARRAGITVTEATDSLALAELVGNVERTIGGWRRTS